LSHESLWTTTKDFLQVKRMSKLHRFFINDMHLRGIEEMKRQFWRHKKESYRVPKENACIVQTRRIPSFFLNLVPYCLFYLVPSSLITIIFFLFGSWLFDSSLIWSQTPSHLSLMKSQLGRKKGKGNDRDFFFIWSFDL
jgi:hypothetical protein